MNKGTPWRDIIAIFVIILLAIYLISCDTTKRAERQQDHIIRTHPNVAMEAIRKIAPCVTTGTSTTFDSSNFIGSIDSIKAINEFYKDLIDNIEPSFIHDTTKLIENNCDGYKQNEYVYKNEIYVLHEQVKELTNSIKNFKPVIKNVHDTTEDLSKVIEVDNNRLVEVDKNMVLQKKVDWWHLYWWIFILIGAAIIPVTKLIIKTVTPIPIKL